MSDYPTAFKGFAPSGESHYIHDPSSTDPFTKQLLSIPLYKAIPHDDDSHHHDEKVFVRLGGDFGHYYIELDTVLTRIFEDARKRDWEHLHKTKEVPILLWGPDGRLVIDVPSSIFDSTCHPDFTVWDLMQHKRWMEVLKAIADSTLPKINCAPFLEPKATVSLWFTPSKSNILTSQDLEHIFNEAFSREELELNDHDTYFCSFDQARDEGLVLVGSNPFHLYHMWMKPGQYQEMWAEAHVHDLQHPWPTHKDKDIADKINGSLNGGRHGYNEQILKVTHQQYLDAITLGEGSIDQKFAMGGRDASKVAEQLWGRHPAAARDSKDFKWLNRVDSYLGGLTSVVKSRPDADEDPATLLARSNIILGTQGFDLHMTRAESAIVNGLNAEKHEGATGSCLLWTVDNHAKNAEIRRLKSDGKRSCEKVEDWITTSQYPWLSLELQYYLAMKCPSLGDVALCTVDTFDPLSKYSPTMVEAKLDRFLAYALRAHMNSSMLYHLSAPFSPLPSPLPTPLQTPLTPTPPSSLFLSGSPYLSPSHLTSRHSMSPIDGITSDGFVKRRIKLFGNPNLTVQLHELQDIKKKAGLHLDVGQRMAVEHATIDQRFHLSDVIGSLKGTEFERIKFNSGTFWRQNCAYDEERPVGWSFTGELVFDENCGHLYDIVTKVLHLKCTTLEVKGSFGIKGAWKRHLEPHSFMLEGFLPGAFSKPIDGVQFNTVGVRLMAIRKIVYGPKVDSVLTYGFGLFGKMELDVPHSTADLKLDYEIREANGRVQISAHRDVWSHPFKVKTTLRNVHFSSSFPLRTPWEHFRFNVSAMFAYGTTHATLAGSYAPRGEFILRAYLPRFGMLDILNLFKHMHGDLLHRPPLHVDIGSATICLSSNKGLEIHLHRVLMEEYEAHEAILTMTNTSVHIHGKLNKGLVTFGDVQLKGSSLDILMESKDAPHGRRTHATIQGDVHFNPHFVFPATAHLYRDNKHAEWTVFATLTDSLQPHLALSKISPDVEHTLFDLVLSKVVFVAASKDHPKFGQTFEGGYKYHKGVQFCAKVNSVPMLNKLVHHEVKHLALRVEWSKASGFNLKVELPEPIVLNLAPKLHTKEFKEISIKTCPPQLVITSSLVVPVARCNDPLIFSFNLVADEQWVKIQGERNEWWINPFGVSKHVKIGPKLTLSLDTEFKKWSENVIPHICGNLSIGKASYTMHFTYNVDLMRQDLHGGAHDHTEVHEICKIDHHELCKTDLVSFASDIAGVPIKPIPDEFSDFKCVKLYIRPAELEIGSVTYLQGFSFQGRVALYKKQAEVTCCIDRHHISIRGLVADFQLGHLKVKGVQESRAAIDCDIGPSNQHVRIGGKAIIYDHGSRIFIESNAPNHPNLKFHSKLFFDKHHECQLHGDYTGTRPIVNLKDADFTLHAEFDHHNRQHVHQMIFSRFQDVRAMAEMSDVHFELDELTRNLKFNVTLAQLEVDTKHTIWKAKEASVKERKHLLAEDMKVEVKHLTKMIQEAEEECQRAVEARKRMVTIIEEEASKKQAEARQAYEKAVSCRVNDLRIAEDFFEHAEKQRDHQYQLICKEDDVHIKVQAIEKELVIFGDACALHGHASGYEVFRKVCSHTTEHKSTETSAELDLICTTDIVRKNDIHFPAYWNALRNVWFAKHTLSRVRKAHDENVATKKRVLESLIEEFEATLEAARREVQTTRETKHAIVELAKKALQDFQAHRNSELKRLDIELANLKECDEHLAYIQAVALLAAVEAEHDVLLARKTQLELLFKSQREKVVVSGWVMEKGVHAFTVDKVRLHGELQQLVDYTGDFVEPLHAHVEIHVRDGKPFTLTLKCDPRNFGDFTHKVFHGLWDHIRDTYLLKEIAKSHLIVE